MHTPAHSRVLLGVTGGIAGYKAALVARELKKRGHEVRCVLTGSAEAFVSPLTLEVLSGAALFRRDYLRPGSGGEEIHITAGEWADVLCLAPASANILAKAALGIADDLLTTILVAWSGPLVLAPAMHPRMWGHEAVRHNVETLKARGAIFVGPVQGELASGEEGIGRLAEPEAIAETIAAGARGNAGLSSKKVVVAAGPTREMVDPVRFLSNRSSGRMGFALAQQAAVSGADVVLVSGPVSLATPPAVRRVDVITAKEMKEAVESEAEDADLVVMTAAVSDFRPQRYSATKLKKKQGLEGIPVELNPDILAGLRSLAPGAVIVGFAAETDGVEANASAKLMEKGADFIVANDVGRADIGFDSDSNEVTVFRAKGDPVPLSRRLKIALARDLLELFVEVPRA